MLATSPNTLAETLFGSIGEWVTVRASSGVAIQCQCCDAIVARLVEDSIIIAGRHHGNWHTTIVSLLDLGYVKHEKTI